MAESGFKLFTDSSCDYCEAELNEMGFGMISYLVNTGHDPYEYLRDGREIDAAAFYERIKDAPNMPKTSMPNTGTFTEAFEPYLKDGQDILLMTLTSKFSNSFSAASLAARELESRYKGRRVVVVDTKSCTRFQAHFVREARDMRDNGATLDEIAANLRGMSVKQKGYVTVDSLAYLQKGGRIGSVAAFAGTLLNIKPIIIFGEGELFPAEKHRGRKRAVSRIIELIDADISAVRDQYAVVVLHSQSREEAVGVVGELEARGYSVPLGAQEVGPTIGAHIGPTVVGAGYIIKHEYV